jgi:hypothetical protein
LWLISAKVWRHGARRGLEVRGNDLTNGKKPKVFIKSDVVVGEVFGGSEGVGGVKKTSGRRKDVREEL